MSQSTETIDYEFPVWYGKCVCPTCENELDEDERYNHICDAHPIHPQLEHIWEEYSILTDPPYELDEADRKEAVRILKYMNDKIDNEILQLLSMRKANQDDLEGFQQQVEEDERIEALEKELAELKAKRNP